MNKRAAEIAARKAAAEAAALAEAAGKIASTENETSGSGMADGGAVAATDDRQGDPEGGSDQNRCVSDDHFDYFSRSRLESFSQPRAIPLGLAHF